MCIHENGMRTQEFVFNWMLILAEDETHSQIAHRRVNKLDSNKTAKTPASTATQITHRWLLFAFILTTRTTPSSLSSRYIHIPVVCCSKYVRIYWASSCVDIAMYILYGKWPWTSVLYTSIRYTWSILIQTYTHLVLFQLFLFPAFVCVLVFVHV